jgi:hypothetical protein
MSSKYNVSNFAVSSILGYIESGDIAIPDIQRPFVWKGSDVRDLIDSLYNGYPTGYLIIWQNPNVRLKDGKESIGKKILIDGQQRVTALMTAIAGKPVLDENFDRKVRCIAFNPLAQDDDERFAVRTPAHDKSKNWIPDISILFKPGFSSRKFINNYLENNPEADGDMVDQAIEKLRSIQDRQLGVIELVSNLDIGEVTEIFVRINSQGKRLTESDFVMSKIAADTRYGGNMLRKTIDYFCHLSKNPAFYSHLLEADKEFMGSIYAPKLAWLKDYDESIYDPDYTDMLRVTLMEQFQRGKLGDLVSLLSGRNFETRTYQEDIAEDSFKKLDQGIQNFMNKYNLESFILAIKSLGFISDKLLNSKMTLDFAYALFLMLGDTNEVAKIEIKRYVQKWFLLSTLTGRYIASPESQMDRDIKAIASKGFLKFFNEVEVAQLSETFWNVGLVQALETSSITSPYFTTFLAAQIKMADNSLLSNSSKVSDLISIQGDVHHIFPKKYLKENGFAFKSTYNQVANYAYLDKAVNISIGDKAPHDYFSRAKKQCETKEIQVGTITDYDAYLNNLAANCIPTSIEDMTYNDYQNFLTERRKLMAQKIKAYYYSI